jgi:biofilm PGA synthesis N-glycosyltransferase PgaC
MAVEIGITLIILLLYSVVMFVLFLGILRLKPVRTEQPVTYRRVAVIVPYRNEAESLPVLLGDLSVQSYPTAFYSVVLVNDHSTDDSAAMAAALTGNNPRFKCLDLPGDREGKKAAIEFAVSQVQEEWIIQTDADCRVGPDFIAAHMSFLSVHPSDLVAGMITTERSRKPLLDAFERLDLLGLTGAGAGSYPFGRPLMCSGANLLYSRDLFLETRKNDPGKKIASGDDMFLLIGARKLGRKISYNPGRPAMAITGAIPDWKELMVQRIRWGGKSLHYRMGDLQALAILVVLAALGVLLIPLFLALLPGYSAWLLGAFGLKAGTDFLVLWAISGLTGQRKVLRWYLPVLIIYYPFLVTVSVGSVLAKVQWKQRRIR